MTVSVGAVGVWHHLRTPRCSTREEYLHHLKHKKILTENVTNAVPLTIGKRYGTLLNNGTGTCAITTGNYLINKRVVF